MASWRGPFASLAVLALLVPLSACGTGNSAATAGAGAIAPAPAAPAPVDVTPSGLRAYLVVRRTDPRQAAHFALLRARPDGLPASTRHILRTPIVGMNWRLAKRIPVELHGVYWLVPGNRHLCVVAQESAGSLGVGTTCAETTEAIAHGIASVRIAQARAGAPSPSRLIVGVAPDGAREVRVHTRGVVEVLPVVEGVFVLRDAIAAPPDYLAPR